MRTPLSRTAAGVLAWCLLATAPSGSQQTPDPGILALLKQTEQAIVALRFADARTHVDEALARAEQIGDRIGRAMAYRSKGAVLNSLGQAREAIDWFKRAEAEFDALGNKGGVADALSGVVTSAALLNDQKMAREAGEKTLALVEALGDDRRKGWLLASLLRANVALVPDVPGQVVAIARRLGDDDLLGEGLRLLASGQFAAGDLAASMRTHEEAIAATARTPKLVALASTYLSLGRVYRAHGDDEGALQRYRKAIDLLAPTEERYTLVEATNAAAIALASMGRHREAIVMYERGLALARESSNQRLIDFMEGNLATGLVEGGQSDRAIPALQAIIAREKDARLLAYRQNTLAVVLTRVGREKEAIVLSDEVVRYTREAKIVDALAAYRFNTRAWILTRLGRLDEALVEARAALDITEQVRARVVPTDFLKRGYNETTQVSYGRGLEILSRLDRGSDALDLAEQGRARAFLDLLAARESPGTSLTTRGEPAAGASGDLASEAIGRPLDTAGIRQIADRLRSTIVSYWVTDDVTLVWVVRPGAEPVHLRLPIPREKLAALVNATTAPLRESAKATTTRGAEAEPAPPASAQDLAALPMRGLGLAALARDDKAAWRELYKILIDPVRAQLPARGGRVTIVPHGPLFQLAFAALQAPAGRYLVEDYELTYAPSASMLAYTGRRQEAVAKNANGPWVVVGNPASLPMVNDRALPPLAGAARELAAVAALAPKLKTGVVRLEGGKADEAALVRALDASQPAVLHFATHGFVFDDPSKPPFLALNRRGASAADDGRLTLDEVYALRLEADLVVLSACRTGSGRVTSDGVQGLARGFFYAGAPSVLATFWDVTDEATATLMSAFYRQYVRTHAKAASLRTAQVALLADLRAGKVVVTVSGRRITLPDHPLLWAGFFLSGEP